MTAAINSTGAGKRGYPTKSSVPLTQASTQRRARERSVAIQTLLLVRKSKSSSVKSKTAAPSGDLQERVLIRHHDYDQCFQSVQLLQWNSQVKFNVTVYRNLPTTRDSIMTS